MYDVVHIKCLSTRSALAVSLQEHHGADPTALSKVHCIQDETSKSYYIVWLAIIS